VVTLDLHGEICPYTFVKTKLALEQLAAGAELRIVVDHAPASRNVPRACKDDGHEVCSVRETAAGEWEIIVRKGVEYRP
jgi:tRNA 2-thiouridine synthesizing protein A